MRISFHVRNEMNQGIKEQGSSRKKKRTRKEFKLYQTKQFIQSVQQQIKQTNYRIEYN
jgi:hypothetical protein